MIAELVAHLPLHAVLGRHAYRTHDGLLGGDATVMLTPAAPNRPAGWHGPVTAELPADPRPPLDVLTYWVNTWRAHTGAPPRLATTLDDAVDWLDRQLAAIAEDARFSALARDLGRVLHSLENVLHAGDRPDVSRVPCWDCGTRLHKVWSDAEPRDYWWCPVCGEVYDHGRYERAKHDHLASRGADRYVPLMDAVAVTGRSEQTVRAWVRAGWVEVRRSTAGRVEVWWPDVRDRHRATPVRRRRGAPS